MREELSSTPLKARFENLLASDDSGTIKVAEFVDQMQNLIAEAKDEQLAQNGSQPRFAEALEVALHSPRVSDHHRAGYAGGLNWHDDPRKMRAAIDVDRITRFVGEQFFDLNEEGQKIPRQVVHSFFATNLVVSKLPTPHLKTFGALEREMSETHVSPEIQATLYLYKLMGQAYHTLRERLTDRAVHDWSNQTTSIISPGREVDYWIHKLLAPSGPNIEGVAFCRGYIDRVDAEITKKLTDLEGTNAERFGRVLSAVAYMDYSEATGRVKDARKNLLTCFSEEIIAPMNDRLDVAEVIIERLLSEKRELFSARSRNYFLTIRDQVLTKKRTSLPNEEEFVPVALDRLIEEKKATLEHEAELLQILQKGAEHKLYFLESTSVSSEGETNTIQELMYITSSVMYLRNSPLPYLPWEDRVRTPYVGIYSYTFEGNIAKSNSVANYKRPSTILRILGISNSSKTVREVDIAAVTTQFRKNGVPDTIDLSRLT